MSKKSYHTVSAALPGTAGSALNHKAFHMGKSYPLNLSARICSCSSGARGEFAGLFDSVKKITSSSWPASKQQAKALQGRRRGNKDSLNSEKVRMCSLFSGSQRRDEWHSGWASCMQSCSAVRTFEGGQGGLKLRSARLDRAFSFHQGPIISSVS